MAMTKMLWSISGLSVELSRDRRTIAKVLAGVRPDGQLRGKPAWRLETALAALAVEGKQQALRTSGEPFGTFLERLEGWKEIYGQQEPLAMPIGQVGKLFRVERANLVTMLRAGMPYVQAGSWEDGTGFVLRPAWVADWLQMNRCLAALSGDRASARRLGVAC